ncbi:LAGLIDADG family homing endonuclease [Halomonas getboli]|uniref:LAGLIDADG family homing endonuclease n=1 Tax=Halomonas getboli TaxID=2935862 RepID=UPI001FFEE7CF|nr:LAGLIDADG family homing endonuclease [Halomonas getboli]MCK2185144.1 ribonucleoside-diphosphate reductase [Halomonas getboli]
MRTTSARETARLDEVPMQAPSLDIWDSKYRLKDRHGRPVDADPAATRERVARALAAVEEDAEAWLPRFRWALDNGAIPAGRIVANAGAEAVKPAVSLINCTVSRTLHDSMRDILEGVVEAGMTLKAGCGIGYDFSTLRPRGAFVFGAGAGTNGPLAFMDIYDRMCFTVASAGGRRGAQMATFDVGHPDVQSFIEAKRESGRLRQFNLSLLITDEFVEAVRTDADWPLAFPLHPAEKDDVDDSELVYRDWPAIEEGYTLDAEGRVACRVVETIRARELWDTIMLSTYDYAEPGFILIDRVNRMNNNWFCEEIRATNPCVTADTRLHTQFGQVPIGDLYRRGDDLQVTVDKRALCTGDRGVETRPAVPAFMTARQADVYRVTTREGYEIKATEWHEFYTQRGKIPLKDLRVEDRLWVQSGKGQFGDQGDERLGVLLGLIAGDGHFTHRGNGHEAVIVNFWESDRTLADITADYINELIADSAKTSRRYRVAPVAVAERRHVFIRSVILARLLAHYGFTRDTKLKVPEVVWRGTEECVKGYLRGLFQADGTVNISARSNSCSIRLASSQASLLKDVQALLANLGVFSRIHQRREAGTRVLPDGKGGTREYECQADHELIIDGQSRERFMQDVGFLLDDKNEKYRSWVKDKRLLKTQSFMATVADIEHVGREDVYDTTQVDRNAVIFNGLVTGQCGEQPLPPEGACLLGSINLTRFVLEPFGEAPRFDWERYRRVVAIFTRMLDNVVEISGLPLDGQRREIEAKRRHGMGFLGLGSALTMLKLPYGSPESLAFTEEVSRVLAVEGWKQALALAKEKGMAPVLAESFELTPRMLRERPELKQDGYQAGDRVPGRILHARYSRYMQKVAEVEPELVAELAEHGARFTHHSSIAPTGTISLSLGNNASNGIEPSFSHRYFRNVIRAGRKTKEQIEVVSFELAAYRHVVAPEAVESDLPDYFVTADGVSPEQHVAVQAAAQAWIDSAISKTVNVPTDFAYEDFQNLYLTAYDSRLKGCTTFRFNPEAFQGVLVREDDLKNTVYVFELENGERLELSGDETVIYEGEEHTAANLHEALKEGTYGKW